MVTLRPVNSEIPESDYFSLHAEDVSRSVNRHADPPRQLQLVLQETSHLLGHQNVAEHPDLGLLPLDVSVTAGQLGGAPDAPGQRTPHLLDVPGPSTVVLADHPFGPLVEVEPVFGHRVTELFGQRLWALQQNSALREDAPAPFAW